MAKPKPTKMLAVFGRCRRLGIWKIASKSTILALFGLCHLDMRFSTAEGDKLTMKVTVLFGSATLVLPPGAIVKPSGMSIFARSLVDVPEPEATDEESTLPILEIEWTAVFGRILIVTSLDDELEEPEEEIGRQPEAMPAPPLAQAAPAGATIADVAAAAAAAAATPMAAAPVAAAPVVSGDQIPTVTTPSPGPTAGAAAPPAAPPPTTDLGISDPVAAAPASSAADQGEDEGLGLLDDPAPEAIDQAAAVEPTVDTTAAESAESAGSDVEASGMPATSAAEETAATEPDALGLPVPSATEDEAAPWTHESDPFDDTVGLLDDEGPGLLDDGPGLLDDVVAGSAQDATAEAFGRRSDDPQTWPVDEAAITEVSDAEALDAEALDAGESEEGNEDAGSLNEIALG